MIAIFLTQKRVPDFCHFTVIVGFFPENNILLENKVYHLKIHWSALLKGLKT
jgi:hypothetical protein